MDLDLTPRTFGRSTKPLVFGIERPLTEADLATLEIERGIKPNRIKKLRDAHHALARLIAQGEKDHEIAALTGYTVSRISVLKSDPAFQDLVSHYAQSVTAVRDAVFFDAQAKMAAIHSDTLDELQDRLDTEPEAIPTETLLDMVKVVSDRTGHGPQSKSTNVNVNVDIAARLGAARQRATRLAIDAVAKLEAVPGLASPQGGPGSSAAPALQEPKDGE